jgi:hypothetical protein
MKPETSPSKPGIGNTSPSMYGDIQPVQIEMKPIEVVEVDAEPTQE